jgi:excisionase family DNA binding protein
MIGRTISTLIILPLGTYWHMKGGASMAQQVEQLFRVSEACERVGLRERQLRQMIADGRLRAVRLKGVRAIRIPASALEQLVEDAAAPRT